MKKINLLALYEHILETCGMFTDGKRHVLYKLNNGSVHKVAIKDDEGNHRYLIMPTDENLKHPDSSNWYFFHPFLENLTRGEPKILSIIRDRLNRNQDTILKDLILDILDISVGNVSPDTLTENQREVIEKIGKVDVKFIETFLKIVNSMKSNKKFMATLSVRKSFKYGDRTYQRGASWSFPLLEEIIKTRDICIKDRSIKPKIFNVDVRKSDINLLLNICLVFFGDDDYRSKCIGVSDSGSAPFTEAFIRALNSIPKRINNIVKTFFHGKHHVYSEEIAKEKLSRYYKDLDWLTEDFAIDNWKKEYLSIPIQDGNEGIINVEQTVEVTKGNGEKMHNWKDVEPQGNELPWKSDEELNSISNVNNNKPLTSNSQSSQPGYQKPNQPIGAVNNNTVSNVSTNDEDSGLLNNLYNSAHNQPGYAQMGQPMYNANQAMYNQQRPQMQVDQNGNEFYIDQYGGTVYTGNRRVNNGPKLQIDQYGNEYYIDQFGGQVFTGNRVNRQQHTPVISAGAASYNRPPTINYNNGYNNGFNRPSGSFFSNNQQPNFTVVSQDPMGNTIVTDQNGNLFIVDRFNRMQRYNPPGFNQGFNQMSQGFNMPQNNGYTTMPNQLNINSGFSNKGNSNTGNNNLGGYNGPV